ncbi:MAG: hypothetical protein ACLRQF_23360 [Thomasclavelia ramosa]
MDMIEVSTIDYLPGYRITKSLGIVFSSKIMNQAIASDNTNIEEMLDTARQEAMAETVAQASRRHLQQSLMFALQQQTLATI